MRHSIARFEKGESGVDFDVADLIKDGFVIPLAFKHGAATFTDQVFRIVLIKRSQDLDIIDMLMDLIKEGCELLSKNQ